MSTPRALLATPRIAASPRCHSRSDDTAGLDEPSEELRSSFAALSEKLLRGLQRLVDQEVQRCRSEMMEEISRRSRELDEEWRRLCAEREKLQQEADALVVKEEGFFREKAAMQGERRSTDVVDLNVGGQAICAVKRSTLCLADQSALASMFSGRWDSSLERDVSGRFFVDFSPDIFMPLVDFLRDKSIEDPDSPVEPPKVPPDRLPAFRRMLGYYGITETVWPRPEGRWEVAWGDILLAEDGLRITVAAQREKYHAAAFNVLRPRSSVSSVWNIVVSKERGEVPWYYDSVAFGIVASDIHNRPVGKASTSNLVLNLRGEDMSGPESRDSVDSTVLGGILSADCCSYNAQIRLERGEVVMAVDGREIISTAMRAPWKDDPFHCCLLVAVTYPWISVRLCP